MYAIYMCRAKIEYNRWILRALLQHSIVGVTERESQIFTFVAERDKRAIYSHFESQIS